jgi:hypothetical protein
MYSFGPNGKFGQYQNDLFGSWDNHYLAVEAGSLLLGLMAFIYFVRATVWAIKKVRKKS